MMSTLLATASGQGEYQGVIWDPPLEQHTAIQDLERMRNAGINAARTTVVTDTTILTVADSLGIQFFQDLPAFYLPATALADSLPAYLDANIDSLVARAQRYESADIIGVAIKSDTSEPATCEAIAAAASRLVDQSSGRISTYYVTEFEESDQCRNGRSLVVMGRAASSRFLRIATPTSTVGVTVGYEVVPGRSAGWRHTHSLEQQARKLEDVLNQVRVRDDISVIFIERWSDEPGRAAHDGDMLKRRFGIIGPGGIAGLSYEVVSGIFTGQQYVYAIDAGTRRIITGVWLVSLGWLLLGALAIAYASSPQMRQMAPRYFFSHGFFRESVAEGRDAIPIASLLMLVVIALSAGIIGTVILNHFSETRFLQALVYSLPEDLQTGLVLFVNQPALLCILIACLYAIFMTSWTSLLSFWSRFGGNLLLPWQTLLLVVWPRWPIMMVMLAALAINDGSSTNLEIFLICLVTLVSAVHAIYRTLNDYRLTAEVKWSRMLVPAMLNPSLVALAVTTTLILANGDVAEFLIHLLQRQ